MALLTTAFGGARTAAQIPGKATMASADLRANRPLSPHLSIYRWRITMAMSIFHRLTGAGLYFGMLILVWWLVAAAIGPDAFAVANGVITSWFGLVVLFLATWGLIHHGVGGLRHYVWDFGVAMEKGTRDRMAWATIIASVVLTILIWAAILWTR
jgi:succinate dehydrogenase / fumarate reductase, cytochrome b subunit